MFCYYIFLCLCLVFGVVRVVGVGGFVGVVGFGGFVGVVRVGGPLFL